MQFGKVLLVLSAIGLSSPASATTIDFGGLTAIPNGDFVPAYQEDGFNFIFTNGEFYAAQVFGNPLPALYAGPVNGGPTDHRFQLSVLGQAGPSPCQVSILRRMVTRPAPNSVVGTYRASI